MTDAQLIANLETWEGKIPWLYRDNAKAGNVTVGVGVMLPNLAAAQALPFMNVSEGRIATGDEIRADFERVSRLRPAMRAPAYKATVPPELELGDQTIDDLVLARWRAVFLPGLRRYLPEYDGYPPGPQRGLNDVVWNVGVGGLAGFPTLLGCCRRRDWPGAARASHRIERTDDNPHGIRPERNVWTHEQFMSTDSA